MTLVDLGSVRIELDRIIAMEAFGLDPESGDKCIGDTRHTPWCHCRMQKCLAPCIVEQVLTARRLKQRHSRHKDLAKCARRPIEASGMGWLEGMTGHSCIYEIE